MNNSKIQTKLSIGIFRAIDVRVPHIEFTAAFKHLNAALITHISAELQKAVHEHDVKVYDIPLKPRYFFDPLYPLLKKTDFTPWMQFDSKLLETVSARFDIYEIYEPYFFYSSQIADIASKNWKPLVTEIWTSFSQHPARYIPPYKSLINNVIHKTDLFVLRTERALQYLEPYRIPASKKAVVYHGIDISRFSPSKQPHEKIRILFVGALAKHKGLDDLLAVFPKLVEKYPGKLELVVCGEGPMQEVVQHVSERLPVRYLGNVPNTELPKIYNKSDIYCQPSKDYYLFGIKGGEEFAGYTFMEAMACGLPIISTYCGGIPEIVGEDNYLLNQADKQSLFQTLDLLIRNKSLRNETGIKNRERAEALFDISKQTEKLERLILEKLS